jgi:MFS family permease
LGQTSADIAADRLPITKAPTIALRWYVLCVMCLGYAISIADRYVVTTVMEPMRLDLHLSDSGIAFLTGPPLALFYVTLGIPISWLVDRSNRRRILACALIAWSAMTALCGLSRNYAQFMLARVGVGIGEAGGTPPANCIIADTFPAARRPMAMAIFALGAPLGAYFGADLAGALASIYGWRAAFLALGVPGLILGLVVITTIREPVRGCLDARHDGAKASFAQSMCFLWQSRAALHVIMADVVYPHLPGPNLPAERRASRRRCRPDPPDRRLGRLAPHRLDPGAPELRRSATCAEAAVRRRRARHGAVIHRL